MRPECYYYGLVLLVRNASGIANFGFRVKDFAPRVWDLVLRISD